MLLLINNLRLRVGAKKVEFRGRKPESKIRGKSFLIPFERLVEPLGRDAIEASQIRVQNHSLPAHYKNEWL